MKIYTHPGPGEHKVLDQFGRNGYVTLTEEEYAEWVAKDTPLGLPPPDEDWDEPELTPPDGQPLNCYHCGQVTRMTRWDMPICARCDKLCRRDHANGRT